MKKIVSVFMAALFMFSFSSVALASSGPVVEKTYYFDYGRYGHNHHHDYDYDYDFDFKDNGLYGKYLEYKRDHKHNYMSYQDFIDWLEYLKDNNYSFGTVHLQGYKNGVAQYR